ncbi:hypothetical protein [Amycolatopsis palatopharyngis]|uniref:hypothetical protein n=1 Tax=Amycolatopsis palatopharyngis TaxID=187982 RepID=UPI0013BE8DC9|nr:hypothetical protein [Amycolatopsis palatopharyngis]
MSTVSLIHTSRAPSEDVPNVALGTLKFPNAALGNFSRGRMRGIGGNKGFETRAIRSDWK